MTKKQSESESMAIQESINKRIHFLRGHKVMLDKDLANLYGIENKQLKRAVKRNIERFPEDFMFELNKEELLSLRSHFGTLKRGQHTKYFPFAFTDYGILMLSSVLNSKRAVQVNIQIMRTFTKLRKIMTTHKELKEKIETIEKKYDYQFKVVFDTIKRLLDPPEKPKKPIGFH